MKTVPCKGCGKPITFVKTDTGKTVPLDTRAPVYRLAETMDGEPLAIRFKAGMVTHFATCKDANKF